MSKFDYKNDPVVKKTNAPVEPEKSKILETLYRVQDQVVKKAEGKGGVEVKEAHRFAREIEREIRFQKYSK